jgi:hypothetical protein
MHEKTTTYQFCADRNDLFFKASCGQGPFLLNTVDGHLFMNFAEPSCTDLRQANRLAQSFLHAALASMSEFNRFFKRWDAVAVVDIHVRQPKARE